jgi:signal transduction histidine kinase
MGSNLSGGRMEPIQKSTSSERSMLVSEMRKAEMTTPALGTLRVGVDDLSGIAHDACNMLTALGLYCELLDEPGVLRPAHRHYVEELRMVAASGRRLVERLTGLRAQEFGIPREEKTTKVRSVLSSDAIQDLATELQANRNLLAALAGPSVSLEILSNDSHVPVVLCSEDLTRILVNLVKNACEAMPMGGNIEVTLEPGPSFSDIAVTVPPYSVLLTVTDTGEGIPEADLNMIFESGYTTKVELREDGNQWPNPHRGLGLAIVRSLVEDAGGTVNVESSIGQGTRFIIELPTVAQ